MHRDQFHSSPLMRSLTDATEFTTGMDLHIIRHCPNKVSKNCLFSSKSVICPLKRYSTEYNFQWFLQTECFLAWKKSLLRRNCVAHLWSSLKEVSFVKRNSVSNIKFKEAKFHIAQSAKDNSSTVQYTSNVQKITKMMWRCIQCQLPLMTGTSSLRSGKCM